MRGVKPYFLFLLSYNFIWVVQIYKRGSPRKGVGVVIIFDLLQDVLLCVYLFLGSLLFDFNISQRSTGSGYYYH